MRTHPEISESKFGLTLHLQARPVPVIPRRRSMDFNFAAQLQLRRAAQSLGQNFFFDFELMFVARVLILASATLLKVAASGGDAMRRRLDDFVSYGPRETRLLLHQRRVNLFRGQHKRYKHSLAPALIVRRKASQSVAAVNQFFNCE